MIFFEAPTPTQDIINLISKPAVQVQQETKEPTKHTIQKGDTLTKIAKKYNTTWQRLWSKNTNLNNQDVLLVGDVLTIPSADEVLTDRPLYTLPVQENRRETTKFSSGGENSYEPGQCVWYVKNRRPDIPNNWGNAYSWLGNAQAQGWPAGSVPVAGAVGWAGNHVVYIEEVRGDKVLISEMNYNWTPYATRTIEVPASKYQYIY